MDNQKLADDSMHKIDLAEKVAFQRAFQNVNERCFFNFFRETPIITIAAVVVTFVQAPFE